MKDYKDYENFLEEKNIRASSQRILMLKYLDENRIHPNAETIYLDLSKSLPLISKATVYNNLKLFVEKGILLEIKAKKNESNYDINFGDHGHFCCESCGKIEDFQLDENIKIPEELEGHTIESKEVLIYGKCKECSSKDC